MGRRAAFTLVELLMVVLIVGILASVAVPAYHGQQTAARDAQVTSRLDTALRVVRAQYTINDGTYPDAATLAAAVTADDPAAGPAAAGDAFAQGQVHVERVSDQRVVLRSQAHDRTNFMIVDDRTPEGRQTARLRGYRRDPTGLSPIVNVMRNPGFESGVRGGWSDDKNSVAVTEMTGNDCWRGNWCGLMTVNDDTPTQVIVANSTGARINVAPGDKVAVRAAFRIIAGSAQELRVYVENFDPYPNQINAGGHRDVVENPEVGKWYQMGKVVPVTGTTVSLTVRAYGVAAGTTFQWDDGMLVHAPADDRMPAYFDGGYGGGEWDVEGPNTGTSNGYLAERAGPGW